MGIALARLAEEDPTFKVKTDAETGQTIISGMANSIWISSSTACPANLK